jgi:folate-binding protein YgfZ
MMQIAALARSVLSVTGADRVGFLNGLVSNDVAKAAPGHCVWAAFLSPQGKWLADFFIFAEAGRLLLDCEAGHAAMLLQRLQKYKLRADVAITKADLFVYAAWDGTPAFSKTPAFSETIAAPDPRLAAAGWRLLAANPLATNATQQSWDLHRLRLGLPDGSRDLEPDKSVLLEAGFDELNGVSWTKGCYMGQELTARTRYRGLIKRRLLPVQASQPLPPPGTPVLSGGREVGTMRSAQGAHGLATLRLEAIGAADLQAAGMHLVVTRPDWARLPEPA